MKQNKKLFNLAVVAIALFVLLLIVVLRNFVVDRRQQVEAAASVGDYPFACQLNSGQLLKGTARFAATDIFFSASADGRFVIYPNLTSPAREVSIWTGPIDFRKVFPVELAAGGTDLNIVDVIEEILIFRLTETDDKINRKLAERDKIGRDESRGPSSLAFWDADQKLQNLRAEGDKLFNGLLTLYSLIGFGSPLPCWYLGLESLTSDSLSLPFGQSPSSGANGTTPVEPPDVEPPDGGLTPPPFPSPSPPPMPSPSPIPPSGYY